MSEPLVRMERISKSYGSVRALDDVSLEVREREIVGLLGDNGAGKSTLIKILSGAITATSGDIFIRGRKVDIRSTDRRDRQRHRDDLPGTRPWSRSSRSPATCSSAASRSRARPSSTAWTRPR